MSLPISASPELYAALGHGTSGFDEIRGTPESDWIDFKQALYHFDDRKQKLELAKDVSAFANARGGVITIGIKTRRPETENSEVADELTPVRDDLLDCRRIRDIIRQYVYPPIVDLGCRTWPIEGGESVLTLEIPRQNGADQPFIVTEGISSEGEHHGNMFGYFKRDADTAQSVPPGVVHDLMRDGYRFRDWLTNGSQQTRRARERSVTGEADEAQSEGRRRSRAHEDAEAAEVVDEPHLILQAWKPAGFQVADIQGPFRNDFLRPPSVRQNGFNLDFGRDVEVLPGGGLRKIRSGAMALSVLPEGLATLVVGSYILGWAMERYQNPELINSIPLVELIYEFCRFTAAYVQDDSDGSDLFLQAQLQRLDASGARRLAAGAPSSRPFHGFGDTNVAAGDVSEVITDVVADVAPAGAAFKLLADIYKNFGLGESAIPFVNVEDRSVDIEDLAAP